MSVKIITDSVADIPKELQEKWDILVLPLMVNFEGGSYKDGVDLNTTEFFEKLKVAKKLPTTSQVNPGAFISAFEEELKNHDHIVCITMSSKMSGTYNAALTAKDYLGTDRIFVVDSKAISFGYGMLAIEAAEMAKAGESAEKIAEVVTNMTDRLVNLFIVDTLEYLQKGGRLSAGEAFIGNLLSIKPIITIEEGVLKSLDKVRGRKRCVKWILDHVRSQGWDLRGKRVACFHATDYDYMMDMVMELKDELGVGEVLFSEVGSVVGTHSGPGCIAFCFLKPEVE